MQMRHRAKPPVHWVIRTALEAIGAKWVQDVLMRDAFNQPAEGPEEYVSASQILTLSQTA